MAMGLKKALIHVSGLIQGIGFRPFVYRLAVRRGLRGRVLNLGDAGVRIELYGPEEAIRDFLRALVEEKPPIAQYTGLEVRWGEAGGSEAPDGFAIAESDVAGRAGEFSTIPPDIAVCDRCLAEIYDPGDRHYMYPFTCCASCGPRFTIMTDLPYDRERTTMADFPMCPDCAREFNDPMDRRFNAQTICCPSCGPKMALYDREGHLVDCRDPLAEAARLLREGLVVAVKGIGGFHLAVRADMDGPVAELRARRGKPRKPLAVMSLTVEDVRKYALVSEVEEELLTSPARPIVVLEKAEPFPLSDLVAPGLHTVGVMLPYSGIHHLLLHHARLPALVMTSANPPGQPMVVSNDEAFGSLGGMADYLLVHDRRIWARCDDSVVRVVDGRPVFLRRSRGYAPMPVRLPFRASGPVVAVGPELSSTGAILMGDKCFLTQHVGDVETLEALGFLEEALSHLAKLLRLDDVAAVACDLHPLFLSRRLASELAELHGAELVEVQHHHAHAASLMAERGLGPDEPVVCLACDGVGYGPDGGAWGGEVLLASYDAFERLGHLEPQPMPGGDVCAYRYGRMLQAILSKRLEEEELVDFLTGERLAGFKHGEAEVRAVFLQLEKGFNVPMTTSTGRLLDAVSCLLGLCYRRTYEGEGAMVLEAAASRGHPGAVELTVEVVERDGRMVLETSRMVYEAYEALREGERVEDIALAFLKALSRGLAEMALRAAEREGIGIIGFTGGVAYNDIMTRSIRELVEAEGLTFIRHVRVPCGDGGLSLGQAVVASARAGLLTA
ncbi:carbamoyltransferase HypF [Candidatus Bathyarchaeota archaeon]|nr:MAG: carbamoyltransferase HypF [Candidatus Bathyarchaeota archaeon]